MPDCSAAQITIGGRIETPDAMADLMDALETEGEVDFEGQPREGWWDHIRGRAEAGEPLVVSATEVPYGVFEAIEEACRTHGLAYHRADDGHYAYGPSNSAWRPGMDEPLTACGNIEEGPAIPLAELLRARRNEALFTLVERYELAFASIPPIELSQAVLDHVNDEDDDEDDEEDDATPTERAADDAAHAVLRAMKDLGVKIGAEDDFLVAVNDALTPIVSRVVR